MYSLYSTLRDLHFCMPGGWNDKYLKIFIQACRTHLKDLKVKDNKNRWHKISEFGAKVSENSMLFTVNSCMEVAECLRSYIERNLTKKANDSNFNSFLSEFEDLLEYFPTQPKIRRMSTDNSDPTTSVACELDDSSSEDPISSSEGILLPSDYCATNSSDSNKSSKLPVKAIGVESIKTLKHPEEINNSNKQKYECQEPQTSKNCKNNPTSERTILLANLQDTSSKKNIENVSDKQGPFKKRGIPPLIDEVQGDLSLCIDSVNDVVAIKGGHLKRAALDDQEVDQEASKLLTSEKRQHLTDTVTEAPKDDSDNFQIFNNPYSTTQDIQPPIKRKRGRPTKNDKIMIDTKSFQPSISGSIVDKNRDISQFNQEMLQQDNNYRQDDLGDRLRNNEIVLIGESRKRKINRETEIRNKSLITSVPDIQISALDNKRKGEINLNPVVKLVDIRLYPNSLENFVISNTKSTEIKNGIQIIDHEKVTASVQPAKKSKSVQDKTKKKDLVEVKKNKQNMRRGRLSKEELKKKMDWEIKNFQELIRMIGEDPSLFNFNYPYPKWFQKKWRDYERQRLDNTNPVWRSDYLKDWKLVVKEWKKYMEQDKSVDKIKDMKHNELLRQRVERVIKRQKARNMTEEKDKSITVKSRKEKVAEENIGKALPQNKGKRKAGGWQPDRRGPVLMGGLPQMKKLPIPSVGDCGLPPAKSLITSVPDIQISALDNKRKGEINLNPVVKLVDIMLYPNSLENFVISNTKSTEIKNGIQIIDHEKVTASVQPAKKSKSVQDKTKKKDLVEVGESRAAMRSSSNSPRLMATQPIICEMEPGNYNNNNNQEQMQHSQQSMIYDYERYAAICDIKEINWFPNFTKHSFEMQECLVQDFKQNLNRELERDKEAIGELERLLVDLGE